MLQRLLELVAYLTDAWFIGIGLVMVALAIITVVTIFLRDTSETPNRRERGPHDHW